MEPWSNAVMLLRNALDWRGPGGKWQNTICLPRELALALVNEIEHGVLRYKEKDELTKAVEAVADRSAGKEN